MKIDFSRNTKRNIVSAFLNKGIGLLFPFLNRTLFLWLLGVSCHVCLNSFLFI